MQLRIQYFVTEEANLILTNQEEDRKERHWSLVQDLEQVRKKIEQVWQTFGKLLLMLEHDSQYNCAYLDNYNCTAVIPL